jgi:single-strand DNA-binding protein
MYNKVILIGNLTKDPELRYTPQGTPVCNFRIAVNTGFKKAAEERKDDTLFIDIVVFGKQGESCSQYLSKGKSVLTEGRLQERRWESDGQQRSKVEVIAASVRFLSRKGDGAGASVSPEEGHHEEGTDLEPF